VDKARSRKEGGSGLGLSICKWIAEAHDGSISAKSELGRGSDFIVRIPGMN
jgi:signal transduction histidine kinase